MMTCARRAMMLAGVLLVGTSVALAGEQAATMTGVLQIDTSGIDSELKGLRAEVAQLQEKLAALEKAITDMSDSVTKALKDLALPDKWEYFVYRGKSDKELNELGAKGWQAVAEMDRWLVLRRPVRQEAPAE